MGTVGQRVKQARESKDVSRKALSKMTGIGYSTIAELERGGMQTSTKLRLISDALGVSLRWLETGKGSMDDGQGGSASQSVSQQRQIIAATVTLVRYVHEMAVDPIPEELTTELIDRATEEVLANWLDGFASEKEVAAAGRSVISKLRAR